MSKVSLSLALLTCCLATVARAESPVISGNVTITNVVIGEGDAGTTPFTAQVSMYGWQSALAVKISATPGTADETDYVFTTTQLTFSGSSSTPQTVSGYILGDTDPEGDEYFTLTATSVAPNSYPYVYSTGGRVTITDDDQAHASQLHLEGASVLEGNQGTSIAEVRVVLEPASSNTVSVAYQTSDGTAMAGQDYQSASGTLTFAPGEVVKTLSLAITGDTIYERDESFSVVLSQPKLALLGTARADVVIVNDDIASHASIADLEVDEGNEGVKSVPVTVKLDHPAPDAGKLQVRLVGVTAVADQDFRALAQTFYPPAGATEMTFNVEILSDASPECDEGLLIQYNTAYLGDDTVKTAKLVLRNDDGPAQGCSDPFTAPAVVEAPRDGGAGSPAPLDGGSSVPPPVDAGPADAVSDALVGWGNVTDTQAASGIGQGPGEAHDSGASPDPAQRLGGNSGCSCSLAAPGSDPGLLLFALAGVLVALLGRSRVR